MSTFIPRKPYSQEELAQLYPRELQLELVQILLRHGERTPVSPRFQDTGLPAYWPYCHAARQLSSVVLASKDQSQWDTFKWRRRLERFGPNDMPIIATGPKGSYDDICNPGELTDRGRETTLALGRRLRHLYVEQLGFMPSLIATSDNIYLRATPIPRALESLQQAFNGLYPLSARTASFPPPTIITRSPADETLFPNDGSCRRFAQLARAFAQRAADRWNSSQDMAYVSKSIGKWMPAGDGRVAVDSRPRLSGVMDTVNATDAHGNLTKLPSEFYDPKLRQILDKINVEEWFQGYNESAEYRALGIGSLLGDVVTRMVANVERSGEAGIVEIGGEGRNNKGLGRGGETDIKLAMSGCHDTTLAAALSSLGAFDGEKWPPFSSHIAFELFRRKGVPAGQPEEPTNETSWWSKMFGWDTKKTTMGRVLTEQLSEIQKASLEGYFVRIRYNDKVMKVPACAKAGNHLEGDESFCTLAAFKEVVDKFTPSNWKQACRANLDKSAIPDKVEPSGY